MPEFCTYTQIKVDDALADRIRAAVAQLSMARNEGGRLSVQEFVSNLLNAETARVLSLKPIKRRLPPPRKRK